MVKSFYYAIVLLLGVAALPALSQGARIAVVTRSHIAPYSSFIDSYRDAHKKSGNNRHTLRVFPLDSENYEEHSGVAQSLSSYGPDIIFCAGTGAVKFAREHFPHLPIVYSMVLSPRELADTGKPGVLGISMDTDPGPKFEVLLAIKPGAKKVGAVYDPAGSGEQVREAAAAAVKAGLEFQALPVASPGEAPKTVERLMSGVDALMLFFDRTVLTPQALESIFISSFRDNVPVIGFSEKYAALGALFSIEARTRDLAREAWKQTEACLADRENCRGIKQPATTGRLVINKKTADKMGLSIPDSIMAKASLVE